LDACSRNAVEGPGFHGWIGRNGSSCQSWVPIHGLGERYRATRRRTGAGGNWRRNNGLGFRLGSNAFRSTADQRFGDVTDDGSFWGGDLEPAIGCAQLLDDGSFDQVTYFGIVPTGACAEIGLLGADCLGVRIHQGCEDPDLCSGGSGDLDPFLWFVGGSFWILCCPDLEEFLPLFQGNENFRGHGGLCAQVGTAGGNNGSRGLRRESPSAQCGQEGRKEERE
jgi:hypothetical protein